MSVVLGAIVLAAAFWCVVSIGLMGVIALLVGGGLGFAAGSVAGMGWAFFGALLGGLVGVAVFMEARKKNTDA